MFVGHYSAGFALKAVKPQLPLWVLLLAVQLVDVGWSLLILAGVEKLRVVPGFLAGSPLDLYYMPYTHSLVATLIWSAGGALAYFLWRRGQGLNAALIVGAAIGSHWLLDLLVHAPDLPLYDNSAKVGFGLWAYRGPELALELGLLAASVWIYARACPTYARRAWLLFGVLTLMQLANTFGPVPPSGSAVAVGALVLYLLFTWAASRVERRTA
ncbi:hypothetical protein E4T66_14320 [Sinimarinibacterium sp. CAU 1509]|uniref:hypothetical protein n=1 Tax=Sinimarinibacterium sp. CAU 1509 TaxID=2562283 RepID=UPI0010ACD853|nr:hypothetical protein [Sinimarinibacterium sp. CAU 1509]TJY58777.1 hypothetical protein E4T66_14320 [Sinimarinibacterium sp. CAU 1509]